MQFTKITRNTKKNKNVSYWLNNRIARAGSYWKVQMKSLELDFLSLLSHTIYSDSFMGSFTDDFTRLSNFAWLVVYVIAFWVIVSSSCCTIWHLRWFPTRWESLEVLCVNCSGYSSLTSAIKIANLIIMQRNERLY